MKKYMNSYNKETGYRIRPIKYLDISPPYHPECRCMNNKI